MKAAMAEAVKEAGGQRALARAISTSQQLIAYMVRNKASAWAVIPIESHTDVSRHKLRPDIFGEES